MSHLGTGVTQMVHKKLRENGHRGSVKTEGGQRHARRGMTMALPQTIHKKPNIEITDDKNSSQVSNHLSVPPDIPHEFKKRASLITQGREANQGSQDRLENSQQNLIGELQRKELQKGLPGKQPKKVQHHDLQLKVRDTSVGGSSPQRSQTVEPR